MSDIISKYNSESIDGIHPISELDLEIIKLFRQSCVNAGLQDLSDILQGYKVFDQDRIIKEKLKDFSNDLSPKGSSNKEETISIRNFIQIEDDVLDVENICSIAKGFDIDYVNDYTSNEIYSIIINKDFPERQLLNNFEIKFKSEQKRNDIYEDIKNKLKEFTNIRFL